MNPTNLNLLTIDIETKSKTENKEDALNPFKNEITVIGVEAIGTEEVSIYRNLQEFKKEIWDNPEFQFLGHNFKFDYKVLSHHLGARPAGGINAYAHDTRLMAYILTEKISEEWLERYEAERVVLNKKLPPGVNHREAGKYSLKTLAPYFLGVDPFWENPADHDSDEYVMKDVRYTTDLFWKLREELEKRGQYDFYINKAMPWARTLLRAELEGFPLDLTLVDQMEQDLKVKEKQLDLEIKAQWADAFAAYEEKELIALQEKYQEMFEIAYAKPTKKPKNVEALQAKYKNLYEKAAASSSFKFNLASPTQMKWLLKDYLKFDIRNFDGEESTGVEVLERLAKSEPEVQKLLDYRETSKILTAFLPTYKSEAYEGRVYSTFNFDGTRTGRLSCSNPNLQQVPSSLKPLFRAEPGTMFATYDLGAIEPVILAYFSQDEALKDIIISGKSFHSVNTIEMFSQFLEPGTTEAEIKTYYPDLRYVAKQCGLGILYGAGWRRIKAEAMRHGYELTEKQCKNAVYNLRDKYSGVWSFKEELDAELESGATLFNLFGRPFRIDNPEDVYMKGLNTLIQGSASDLTQESATRIGNISGCIPIAFIHDSVVTRIDGDVGNKLELIEKAFKDYDLGDLPLTVEGGLSNVWE